jgi:hypothetical protein
VSQHVNQIGRWIVRVTGNGSLELTKADDKAPRLPLVASPMIKDYSQITKEVDATIGDIGPGDVLKAIVGGGGK